MIIVSVLALSLIILVGLDKSLEKYSNFITGLVKPESTNKDKFKNLLLFIIGVILISAVFILLIALLGIAIIRLPFF